jgi:hypothetical protein
VKLPGGTVDLSVHAIGDQSKVDMEAAPNIFGMLLIKRYTVPDQTNPRASLKGQLEYNANLNAEAAGGGADIKPSHLFVTISPYILSKEIQLKP